MKKEKFCFESKYLIFYWGNVFDISFESCGYFDNRPRINFDIIFFSLTLILPFRNKWTDECDPPKWGIAFHDTKLWIYLGGKGNMNGGCDWYTITMPWYWQWYSTSVLKKDGTWETEKRGNRKEFYLDKWKDVLWYSKHLYNYTLKSGEVQHCTATIRLYKRVYRMHWLQWLPFFNKTYNSIDIQFSKEVGEETGSWKGGTIGCGYEIKGNETPFECLKRMEKERKF